MIMSGTTCEQVNGTRGKQYVDMRGGMTCEWGTSARRVQCWGGHGAETKYDRVSGQVREGVQCAHRVHVDGVRIQERYDVLIGTVHK